MFRGISYPPRGPFGLIRYPFDLYRGNLNFPGSLWSVQGLASLLRSPSYLARDCACCFVTLPTCSEGPPTYRGPSVLARVPFDVFRGPSDLIRADFGLVKGPSDMQRALSTFQGPSGLSKGPLAC